MTTEQKQHLLAYLGYYTIEVDGNWGNRSKQATEKFQKAFGLEPDGVFGEATEKAIRHAVCYGMPELGELEEPETEEEKTGTFWDEIDFFDREEFKCTCGGRGCNDFPSEPCERLVRNLEQTRKHFGRASRISSGVRCQLRNSELPGSAGNSLHMRGKAADFCILGLSAREVLAYRKKFYQALDACGIDNPIMEINGVKRRKYTPHSCRHTFSTLMKNVQAPDKDKLALIGHTSDEMLRHYQDVDIEGLRRITNAM